MARAARGGDRIEELVRVACSFPDAVLEEPWGEQAVKVNRKIFAFFGTGGPQGPRVALKLPFSASFALTLAGASPTSHGLGRSGWVTFELDCAGSPADDLIEDLMDESYRAVAPRRLVTVLDRRAGVEEAPAHQSGTRSR